jgi:pimeloyl-ACP methyl ester carboxylesterase
MPDTMHRHFYVLLISFVTIVLGSHCQKDDAQPGWVCAQEEHSQLVDVGEVTLEVTAQGCPTAGSSGGPPTVVLLHGYPDFAVSWRPVLAALADRYQVVAPDQRGYRGSDAPAELEAYEATALAEDVRGLIDAVSDRPVLLVGHDWGGAVAWLVAHTYPERLAGLIIINAPHPDVFARELAENPDQLSAAGYMNTFLNPLAEDLLSANDYQLMMGIVGASLPADLHDYYRAAYARPGRLTSMLNWYRANVREGPTPAPNWPTDVTVAVPTLVLWGLDDTALLPGNVVGLDAYVPDLQVQELPGVSHWVVHEAPATVIAAIESFAATHLAE